LIVIFTYGAKSFFEDYRKYSTSGRIGCQLFLQQEELLARGIERRRPGDLSFGFNFLSTLE
jgi:hypothetical protein